MNIQDIFEGFQEALIDLHTRDVRLIPEVVYLVEDMSLSKSLWRGLTAEVLGKVLGSSVVEANNP